MSKITFSHKWKNQFSRKIIPQMKNFMKIFLWKKTYECFLLPKFFSWQLDNNFWKYSILLYDIFCSTSQYSTKIFCIRSNVIVHNCWMGYRMTLKFCDMHTPLVCRYFFIPISWFYRVSKISCATWKFNWKVLEKLLFMNM